MNTERDKFLAEAMGGWWHYSVYTVRGNECSCGKWWSECSKKHPDFSTWEGFGKLLKWSIEYGEQHNDKYLAQPTMALWYLTPDRFANAVYKHLKKNKQ